MDLLAEILLEHSRKQCDKIVDWVGNNQKRFDELFLLFTTGEYRVIQRSAWPMSYCVEANPNLLRKHFDTLMLHLQNPTVHNSVKRNTVRLLQHYKIPEKHKGAIMNLCFQFVEDVQEKASVKAFSLTVLQNLSKEFPEILPEIKCIVEERWNTETPAFKSRARVFMK